MDTERNDVTQPVVSSDAVAPAVRFAFVDGLRGLSAMASN